MATRQSLREFLGTLPRGAGADSISYVSDTTSVGSPDRLEEGDDLGVDPGTATPLIGFGTDQGIIPRYAAFITDRAGNAFPIDGTAPTQVAASSHRGESLQPAEDQGATSVFIPSNEYPTGESYFDGAGYTVSSIVDKTGNGSVPTSLTGDALLIQTVARETQSDVQMGQTRAVKATFAALKKYNKYADATGATDPKFVEATTNSQTFDNETTYNFQAAKGQYVLGDTTDSSQVVATDLHETAHSMLLKAAGWDTSTAAAFSDDPAKLLQEFEERQFQQYPDVVSVLLPDQVRPRESFGAPTYGETSLLGGKGEAVPRIGDDARYSRGSTTQYTPDNTFTWTTQNQSARQQISIYQAAIAINSLGKIVFETLSRYREYSNDTDLQTSGLGPYYMGLTTRSKTSAKLRAIFSCVLANTGRFAYSDCVKSGIMLYFGVDPSSPSIRGNFSFSQGNTSATGPGDIFNISQIGTPGVNTSVQERLAQSHGFWAAVSRSCLRMLDDINFSVEQADATYLANTIVNLLQSRALKMVNVFAQIGYTYMSAHLGMPGAPPNLGVEPQGASKKLDTAFSVDSFDSLPGTRMMKSREKNGPSALSLSWRNSVVPSALILPPSLIQATLDMDYILSGPNAVKHMVNTSLKDKTYAMARTYGRIPIEVVNNIENRLDAEYVPFYFHDLRTNEIVGFHAFLESLSDSFAVTYNSTQAHGRADAVKNYSATKRSLSFSFNVVSTSEEDFDEMWAKINKLVTLLYPQYTRGVLNVAKNKNFNDFGNERDFYFEQPFSQIVGGTPVIRLRIGDVVKSNYSRFNLSRLFGAGSTDTGATSNTETLPAKAAEAIATATKRVSNANVHSNFLLWPLLAMIGSPVEFGTFNKIQSGWYSLIKAAIFDAADIALKNGFVNPLMSLLLTKTTFETLGQGSIFAPGKDGLSSLLPKFPDFNGRLFLKPRAEPYVFKESGKIVGYVKVTRPQLVEVKGLSNFPAPDVEPAGAAKPVAVSVSLAGGYAGLLLPETFIRVPTQPGSPVNKPAEFDINSTCDVTLDDCLFDPDAYFNNVIAYTMIGAGASGPQSLLVQGATSALTDLTAANGYPVSTNLLSDFFGSYMRQFTSPAANPITNTIEGSMSRGLAGVITSMQFNWIDSTTVWDTNWNSRAPTACKITVNFDPIHDISPGLDAYGANRAPVYNVGANRMVAGDPHPDGGLKSKFFYDRSGAETNS
jgi:hypothetical protein